ncbi:MAG: hypothetical protein IJA94_06705 [Bacilli bacterium]|nr:hypothetical protein [Bacilli bacterium]MBQ3415282.1 hypothetical protein [Clostridia bacterium]MBQ4584561.1 hypothetical protein [Bacilli bacterium]MBR0058186.1 hypothetical protein [Methanobrevibacter sp.]MBR0371565.1 hypothetical protein [Methanobrevibacter sp.]
MDKEEIKRLIYYKKIIKKEKKELIKDFNNKIDHLNKVEQEINEELKRLRLE